MDRYWLITWTCYGLWLPGDRRGFVGNVRNIDGSHVSHNVPGTPYDADEPFLEAWTRQRMKGDPVTLDTSDAGAIVAQFQETARIRVWSLEAVSAMFNHVHLVVGVSGDPDPDFIRDTFKSWATRALKKRRPLPQNGTFWTEKGSVRKLEDEEALKAAVVYVARKQPNPLATWWDPRWQEVLDEYDKATGR